jgi:hypothetical protein
VEVEAAVCGLPLFLTRHHGSEMILEDGRNGRFMEFNAEAIAGVLAEFISGRWTPSDLRVTRALDKTEYARRLAAELQSVCGAISGGGEVLSPALPAR